MIPCSPNGAFNNLLAGGIVWSVVLASPDAKIGETCRNHLKKQCMIKIMTHDSSQYSR